MFSPWAALAVVCLPATARRVAAFPAVAWTTAALAPYAILLSKYSVWWAGHSFGPRYWTEASVPLAILLGFAIDWSLSRSRALRPMFPVAVAWSIALQAAGAWCYPSTWNRLPADVDRHHERLWDWSDTEIGRCLAQAWGYRQPLVAGSSFRVRKAASRSSAPPGSSETQTPIQKNFRESVREQARRHKG